MIEELREKIKELAEKHYSSLLEELQSIPGVRAKTAINLAVISEDFTKFSNYRQLNFYVDQGYMSQKQR